MKKFLVFLVVVVLVIPSLSYAQRKPRYKAVAVSNGGTIKGKIQSAEKVKDPVIPIEVKPKENPAETELMAKSVRRLHKGGRFGRLHSEGPAMLIIEHKLSELMRIVDRVIVINFGELIAAGPPEEVMRHPTVVEAYTGKKEVL